MLRIGLFGILRSEICSAEQREHKCEVCTSEIKKEEQLDVSATLQLEATYKLQLKAWNKADRLASQIIVKSIEAKAISLQVIYESARDIWLKLQIIFEQQIKQAGHTVHAELFSFRINSADDVVSHKAKFEVLILRIQQFNLYSDESSLMVKLLDTLRAD